LSEFFQSRQTTVSTEIANDNIAGDPIAITYCPLCGSGIAYEGKVKINDELVETEFGTSGKLYNSNLIMYDALTDTYWTQIDGLGIVGELTGQKLISISVDTVVWRDWKNSDNAKNAEVLSQETGMNRNYGRDPYGNYYEDSFLKTIEFMQKQLSSGLKLMENIKHIKKMI